MLVVGLFGGWLVDIVWLLLLLLVVLQGFVGLDLPIIKMFLVKLFSISLLLLLLLLLLLVASREQANIIFIGVDRCHCWLYNSLAEEHKPSPCVRKGSPF